MFLETIKTDGIAHLSYIFGSQGEACVIDPQLDTARYIAIANANNCTITTIIETHRNEDFISGALALSNKTSANVFHGPNADAAIAYAQELGDGSKLTIGKLEIEALHTPGHTKDSICLALIDTATTDGAVGVFTGDTLFVNDVGRADFYPDEKEAMAAKLYDSLQRLLQLGDEVIVYPAHGAGSVCGGGMADREFTTIGVERKNNPLLKIDGKDSFIRTKVAENHYIAPYFAQMEKANSTGVDTPLPQSVCMPIANEQKESWLTSQDRPGYLLDIRSVAAFQQHHIPGSLNFPGALLSAYAGWLLEYDKPIALVCTGPEQAFEGAQQLWRMGYQNIAGYLTNIPFPVTQTDKASSHIPTVTADTVKERLDNAPGEWVLLDVRKNTEVESMPFPGGTHMYLGHLKQNADDLNKNVHYTCMCGSGMRATVAASYLKYLGIDNVDIFDGSMQAWKQYQS